MAGRRMKMRAPMLAAAIAATLASLAFVNAPAVARERSGPVLSQHQASASLAADKKTGSGKGRSHAQHGNKGGQERGLNRADGTAGVHGDRGRDRAANNSHPR